MKKGFTVRERILLIFLSIISVCAIYYYVFYIPVTEEIQQYEQEKVYLEDEAFLLELQVVQMNQMQSDIDDAYSTGGNKITPLPAYDNSRQLLNELYSTLSRVREYEVEFDKEVIDTDNKVVRRYAELFFSVDRYSEAKDILVKISTSKYRNLINDISINKISGHYNVYVEVTFFEYLEEE